MFPRRFWPGRFFAPRYWPGIGGILRRGRLAILGVGIDAKYTGEAIMDTYSARGIT